MNHKCPCGCNNEIKEGRVDRVYYSPSCRIKAHRQRKALQEPYNKENESLKYEKIMADFYSLF